VLLTARWHDLVVPDDLVRFSGPGGATLVANPGLASWAALDPGADAVLQALADGVPVPALPAAAVERSLATLVLNWLVYLPGRQPVVREDPPTFEILYYAITDGCNLRCPYCYASSTRRLPGELGTDASLDLVDQAAALGVRMLVLTGGEPMLRRDLYDVAAHARSAGLRVNMITNATLLRTAADAARIADLFDQVTVSVDGGTAELHERTRGAGTFATTIAALRLLNAAGVEPIINHVVSEENVDHLADLARTLAGIRVRQVRLMHHSALGRGAHDNVAFDWEHYRSAHEFVWTSPLARNLLPDGPTAAKPCSLRGNCGLAGTEIYVDSLGDVYPCKLITDKPHRAGNIRDTPLAELYADPMMAGLRSSSALAGVNLTDCGGCYIRGACGGGCRAYHLARSGDLLRNARSFCRVLRHQMVSSMWASVGAGRETLVDAGDGPYVPVLVKGGGVHHAYEDWRPARRLLPLVTAGE
jgi:radical SAM protein with 4Fe4S-binding SPASM domain